MQITLELSDEEIQQVHLNGARARLKVDVDQEFAHKLTILVEGAILEAQRDRRAAREDE